MNLLQLILAVAFAGGIVYILCHVLWNTFSPSFRVVIEASQFGIKKNLLWHPNREGNDPISYNNEIGYTDEIISSGNHWFVPFLGRIEVYEKISVPYDELAYIYALTGKANSTQDLKSIPLAKYDEKFGNYENVKDFHNNGGMQGLQEYTLKGGASYAIHPQAFLVFMKGRSVIGKPMLDSTYAESGKKSEELLGFNPERFNIAPQIQSIEWGKLKAICLDNREITFDKLLIRIGYENTKILTIFHVNNGRDRLFDLLRLQIEAGIYKIILTKESKDWWSNQDTLQKSLQKMITRIINKFNLTTSDDEIIINNLMLEPGYQKELLARVDNATHVETAVTAIEALKAEGRVNLEKAIAGKQSGLGEATGDLEISKIQQDTFKGLIDAIGKKAAMIKMFPQLITDSTGNTNSANLAILSAEDIINSVIAKFPDFNSLDSGDAKTILSSLKKEVLKRVKID